MRGLCLDTQDMILDRQDVMICDGWKQFLDEDSADSLSNCCQISLFLLEFVNVC